MSHSPCTARTYILHVFILFSHLTCILHIIQSFEVFQNKCKLRGELFLQFYSNSCSKINKWLALKFAMSWVAKFCTVYFKLRRRGCYTMARSSFEALKSSLHTRNSLVTDSEFWSKFPLHSCFLILISLTLFKWYLWNTQE